MREVIEQNMEAARISVAEIRMLFGNWKDKRQPDRRKHSKKYNHAERRVGKPDRRA